MEYLVFVPLLLVVGLMLAKVVRHGGVKAAMFGAAVGRAVGEVPLSGGPRLGSHTVKVHVLEGTDKQVGVEIAARGPFGFSMVPVSLSRSEARRLADLLLNAAGDRPGA